MIQPNNISTVNSIVVWSGRVTNFNSQNNGVEIHFNIPSDFELVYQPTLTKGVYNNITSSVVVDMSPNEIIDFNLVLKFNNPTNGFNYDYHFIATISGLDTISENNILDDVVNYNTSACGPLGGGVEDFFGCLCIDVSLNDTPCTEGISQWILNTLSVVNSNSYRWDPNTGKGSFTPIDPSEPITGTYKLNCINGLSTVEVTCDVPFTIYPQLESKKIFDHKVSRKYGVDLTDAEVIVFQSQPEYSLLDSNQIRSYCWDTILNNDGEIVGGIAFDCNEKQDTRTFFECSAEECIVVDPPCPDCSGNPQGDLPSDVYTIIQGYVDYEAQIGDIVYVSHPLHNAIYKWNGSQWKIWDCGCQSKPINVVDFTITGTGTKTATITLSNGTTLEATFDDIDTNTTYTLDDITTPGTIYLKDNMGTIVSTVVLPMASGDNWGTQKIQHALNSASSGDGTLVSPLLVESCKPVNLEITEVNGPGTISHLDIEGVIPTDAEWDTWEWQYNLDWVFNADNSNWITAQTGGLDFNIGYDEASVRVKLTIGSCIYYSNVSGMYDHPNFDCRSIELFIPPFDTEVGVDAILHVSGINNVDPLWNTWIWQTASIYGIGLTPNPNPVWINAQTGGLSFNIGGDDMMVRVVLTNGNCIWWSNESGYEHAFDVVECPIRLEAFLGSNVDVFPVITGPNNIEYKTNNSPIRPVLAPPYSPNSFIFQELGNLADGPAFTWTDVQTGEDPASNILKYVGGDGKFYRIKYTHTDGCVYYSNIVGTYFV